MLSFWRTSRRTSCSDKNNTNTGKHSGAYGEGRRAEGRLGDEACAENSQGLRRLPPITRLVPLASIGAFLHAGGQVGIWKGGAVTFESSLFSTLHLV